MEYHKKYANKVKSSRVNNMETCIKYISNDQYKGYISYLKMIDVKKPFIRKIGSKDICFGDNGYIWIQTFEEDKKYSITIMLDEKENIVQWYVDIIRDIGLTSDGTPYIEDLYLDLDILPNGEFYLLDEDEILEALNNGIIDKEHFNFAYNEVEAFRCQYEYDLEKLYSFSSWIFDEIKKEL